MKHHHRAHAISSEQRSVFNAGFKELNAVNMASLGASYVSEFLVGHSAPSINSTVMDTGDAAIPFGLAMTEAQDRKGDHIRAARFRQSIYAAHIALALYGTAESGRLMYDGEVPQPANIAIAVGSGAVNLHILRRQRRRQAVSPTDIPVVDAQDAGSRMAYEMNINAQGALAKTNLWESAGSVGTVVQYVLPFGASASIIASNVAVIGVLGKGLVDEERQVRAMKRAGIDDAVHQPVVEPMRDNQATDD